MNIVMPSSIHISYIIADEEHLNKINLKSVVGKLPGIKYL